MTQLGVAFRRLGPSRYGEGLRRALRRSEPGRRVDLLLCGALIEARSHERFVGLIARLRCAARGVLCVAGGGRGAPCRAVPEARRQARAGRGSARLEVTRHRRGRARDLAGSASSGFTRGRRRRWPADVRRRRWLSVSEAASAARSRCRDHASTLPCVCQSPSTMRRTGSPSTDELVHGGPVRVAVDQRSDPARAKRAGDRLRVHVHDFRGRGADVHAAAFAHPLRQRAPSREAQAPRRSTARPGCARCAAGAGSSCRRCRARRRACSSTRSPCISTTVRRRAAGAPVSSQKRRPIRKSRLPCITKQGTPESVSRRSAATTSRADGSGSSSPSHTSNRSPSM